MLMWRCDKSGVAGKPESGPKSGILCKKKKKRGGLEPETIRRKLYKGRGINTTEPQDLLVVQLTG
jgi:hypothetical protein